jgi:hypothetical protein
MSVQRADLMGTQHIMNITYPTPRETLYTAATTLPTSEPATATFSYTVGASDLATYDGVPLAYSDVGFLYAGGQNASTASATLCYRIKKNTTSIATATNLTVTASQYWTLNASSGLVGIVAGDSLEVFLWQSTANLTGALTWNYQAFTTAPSRIQVNPFTNTVLVNLTWTVDSTFPTLSLGTPSINSTSSPLAYYGAAAFYSLGSTFSINTYTQNSTYKMLRLYYGEIIGTPAVRNSATAMPYYDNNRKITKLSWTPTNIIL